LADAEGIERLAARGVIAFAMESIPRITRAQPMDALSSQATVAGYKAVVLAAERLPRFFPMLMTAAGTVAPAKVLVLGAGVAGLAGAAPDPGGGGARDAPRLGRGRHRGGDRRELRADAAGRDGGARGRDDRRPDEPAEHDAVPREPALRAERRRAAPAPGPAGRARAGLGRRDHRRRLRDSQGGGGGVKRAAPR